MSLPIVRNSMRKDILSMDDYFMGTAVLSSKRSRDPATQVGAVIVNEDNHIVATGYNCFPKGCDDDKFPWYKYKEVKEFVYKNRIHHKKWFVVHAEANAILSKNCANLKNTRIYTTLYPCSQCAKLIVRSGITKVYYKSNIYAHEDDYKLSASLFEKAKIECIQYTPQKKEIVINL